MQEFIDVSARKMKNAPSHKEQFIQDYLVSAEHIASINDKVQKMSTPNPKLIEAVGKIKDNVDGYFINSGAAECDQLEAIYAPKVEENKDNIEYLNKVLSVMSMLKCTNEDTYLTAAEYALAIEPTAKAAMGCGYRYYKKGEIDKALEFFDQAIELETSITTKAELCYKVGLIHFSLNNYGKARAYANKALGFNNKYGQPHILIAQCYGAANKWSEDDVMNACTYYLCLDRLDRAKAVDPSSKREADKLIAIYSKHTPKVEDLFMRGYEAGKSVKIGGWINETTKIR